MTYVARIEEVSGRHADKPGSAQKASKQAFSAFSEDLSSEMNKLSDFDEAFTFVTRKNKGYVPGKNPMKFGIMQTTLRDYDPKGSISRSVADLNEDKAKQIYQKIWQRAGCDKLSYPLNVIHFDAYVQRPSTAMEALRKSESSPEQYLKAREASLSKLDSFDAFGTRWNRRIQQLRSHVEENSHGLNAEQIVPLLKTSAEARVPVGTISAYEDPRPAVRGEIAEQNVKDTGNNPTMSTVKRSPIPKPQPLTEAAAKVRKSIPRSAPSPEPSRGTDFDEAFTFVIRKNRGYVDGKNPMKFGIMQTTLKDYDPKGLIARRVDQLDEEKAKKIYHMMWQRAGCDELSFPLNLIHFDAYVQRPATAVYALKESKGDPEAYLKIRKLSLSELDADKAFENRWKNRLDELRAQANIEQTTTGTSQPTPRPSNAMSAAARAIEKYESRSFVDFDTAFSFVLQHEGETLVASDNGKGPSKFGILQMTLKRYDPKGEIARQVKDLDRRKAKQIYRKIWQDAGCDKLSYPMNVLHFDTIVHRPKTAMESMRTCGGDPELYLQTRLASLKELRSYQEFGDGWEKRIESLSEFIKRE